jgi:hypothetical protein
MRLHLHTLLANKARRLGHSLLLLLCCDFAERDSVLRLAKALFRSHSCLSHLQFALHCLRILAFVLMSEAHGFDCRFRFLELRL